MVVVEDHRDVGFLLRQPAVDIIEALEERPPVRIILLLVGDGLAYRRNMGGRNAADDMGHGYLPAATSFALKSSTLVPVCCAPMSCTFRPKIPASFAR